MKTIGIEIGFVDNKIKVKTTLESLEIEVVELLLNQMSDIIMEPMIKEIKFHQLIGMLSFALFIITLGFVLLF